MDWSILRLDVQYPLLRKEMVYSNHIYVSLDSVNLIFLTFLQLYYFAIVCPSLPGLPVTICV
jgi:hypothetical protein